MSTNKFILNHNTFAICERFHCMQKKLKDGTVLIDDLGSIVPASVMLHDIVDMKPTLVSYMNNWGCEQLGTSVEEINALGETYYDKYFVPDEVEDAFDGIGKYLLLGNFDNQYNFFQRVKLHHANDFKWFYSVCKLMKLKTKDGLKDKMIVLSSPVEGMDLMISRINRVLDQDVYIKNNYRMYASLTKREKTIICMVANGKSSKQIAEELFISIHTVHTHRKNIILKTECQSFANLLKFAVAFELY